MKETTISARVETVKIERFKQICELMKINPSDFLRGCIVVLSNHKEPDMFLQELGFVKKSVWVFPIASNLTQESSGVK
jgi:hypothetical protein